MLVGEAANERRWSRRLDVRGVAIDSIPPRSTSKLSIESGRTLCQGCLLVTPKSVIATAICSALAVIVLQSEKFEVFAGTAALGDTVMPALRSIAHIPRFCVKIAPLEIRPWADWPVFVIFEDSTEVCTPC
jgi:hypothetical protein